MDKTLASLLTQKYSYIFMLILIIFNQKEHSLDALYLSMHKSTVTRFTMEFVLLVSAHQFRLLLVSLVDLFHHLRLATKVSQQ